MIKTFKLNNCIFPNCDRPEHCRGLCPTHYMAAAQLVCRKKTTWKDMEKNGTVKPISAKNGRATRNQNYFLAEKK